jgi:Hsp20/alpha crystallin family
VNAYRQVPVPLVRELKRSHSRLLRSEAQSRPSAGREEHRGQSGSRRLDHKRRGRSKKKRKEKNKDYYLQERNFGSFQRSFELPESVDPDKIEATFKKGGLSSLPWGANSRTSPNRGWRRQFPFVLRIHESDWLFRVGLPNRNMGQLHPTTLGLQWLSRCRNQPGRCALMRRREIN